MKFAAFFSGRGVGVLRLLDPVSRAAPHVRHRHAQQQLDRQHRQRSPRPLPGLGYVMSLISQNEISNSSTPFLLCLSNESPALPLPPMSMSGFPVINPQEDLPCPRPLFSRIYNS